VKGETAMDEQDAIGARPYNYAEFIGDDDFLAFRTALPTGNAVPDVAITVAATGDPGRLSDYWREADVVIEFGSLT
jgi:hypothetical protein